MPNSADRVSDDDHGIRSWHQGPNGHASQREPSPGPNGHASQREPSPGVRVGHRAQVPNPLVAKCFGFPSSAWARQIDLLSERTLERASDGAPGPAIGAADFTGERVGDRAGAAMHVFSSFSSSSSMRPATGSSGRRSKDSGRPCSEPTQAGILCPGDPPVV
jgi:hypothetical protein